MAVIFVLASVGLSIWWPYYHTQKTIEQLWQLGAVVETRDYSPSWIPNCIDDRFPLLFERISCVSFFDRSIGDDELIYLDSLYELEVLILVRANVSNDGLEHIRSLNNLVFLDLECTNVSDAGLKHLHGLKKLNHLQAYETGVTPDGVNKLQKHLPDCDIVIDEPLDL